MSHDCIQSENVFLIIDNPQGLAKDIINWAIGEHGQDIVKWVGYFPIWQSKLPSLVHCDILNLTLN